MTASAGPALERLHRDFGDRVAFVTLYVREAHPGDRYPQAETFEQKLGYARRYRERDRIPWPVAVDSIEGDLHRALDGKPNAAYVMDTGGRVAFRALWSNDERVLRPALDAITSGRPPPIGEDESKLVPMVKGMGAMYGVLDASGPMAKQDVWRAVPPMYAMARLAAVLRPLPPLARGAAAMGAGLLMLAAVAGGIGWLARRRR